jgi:hypothetical protein
MAHCKGFGDWLECLQCPHLCTKVCPIESENVMEAMEKKMRTLSVSEGKGEGRYFGQRE